MKELLTVVTRKGQITVPAEIRKALNLRKGDKVALSLSDARDGEVTLRPVRSVAEMTFGSVPPRKQLEDFQELRQVFAEELADEAEVEAQSFSSEQQ